MHEHELQRRSEELDRQQRIVAEELERQQTSLEASYRNRMAELAAKERNTDQELLRRSAAVDKEIQARVARLEEKQRELADRDTTAGVDVRRGDLLNEPILCAALRPCAPPRRASSR